MSSIPREGTKKSPVAYDRTQKPIDRGSRQNGSFWSALAGLGDDLEDEVPFR